MESNGCDGAHTWRELSEDEVKEIRSKTRQGRPSGAWLEAAEQCEKCGQVQAKVSWWGQLHSVPYAPREAGGQPVIQWPTRQQSPGGAGGMG